MLVTGNRSFCFAISENKISKRFFFFHLFQELVWKTELVQKVMFTELLLGKLLKNTGLFLVFAFQHLN